MSEERERGSTAIDRRGSVGDAEAALLDPHLVPPLRSRTNIRSAVGHKLSARMHGSNQQQLGGCWHDLGAAVLALSPQQRGVQENARRSLIQAGTSISERPSARRRRRAINCSVLTMAMAADLVGRGAGSRRTVNRLLARASRARSLRC